jgi:hypothetical protein
MKIITILERPGVFTNSKPLSRDCLRSASPPDCSPEMGFLWGHPHDIEELELADVIDIYPH